MTVSLSTQSPISLSQRGLRAPEQPISRLMGLALANPEAISLAAGFVDNQTLPVEEVQAVCQRLFGDPQRASGALQYGTNTGHPGLRQRIARRYFEHDQDQLADRMILTAGSNQFLQMASECLLDPGDIVLCGAPSYFVYLYILRDIGARAFGVAMDDQGIVPERLDAALSQLQQQGDLARVRALYLVPYFDNPAGTNMSIQRRKELIEVIDRWDDRVQLTLLVDNAYRDLRYEGEDVPSMLDVGANPQTTVETGTFSKNLSPGLRVGWGIPPEPLHSAMDRRKALTDFGSPFFNQVLVSGVLASDQFDSHLEILRAAYRAKRDAMVQACDQYLADLPGVHYETPRGGLYVWLTLPEAIEAGPDGELWRQAIEAGVLYVPGEFFYPAEGAPVRRNTMRLSFGVQSESRIARGIEILAETVRRQLG